MKIRRNNVVIVPSDFLKQNLFVLCKIETLVESVNTSACIYKLLLTCEVRVAV